MKGLIKLFTAAAFVGALASCSDDLSISKGLDANADLYASLPSEETTRMGVLENKAVVWSEGDVINVYSANALKFNVYDLTSGAGESVASFTVSKDNGVASLGDLVAVSSSEYLKGVHADENNKMNLIAIIPANFTQNELVNDQKTVYWPLAIPYYDTNISFTGNQLNANMKPLTALLKIDIKALPEGTKAIVLNTHHSATVDGGLTELGGSDEALSGTLTTILEDGAALKVDEDYKHADTLRVDIDELDKDQDKIIYVPIIAGHYDKLSVLAVSEDDKDKYSWPGAEVLRVFEDQDFEVNGKYGIAQTATQVYDTAVEGSDAELLSKWIAEQIINDGTHTLKVLVKGAITGDKLLLMNNPEIKQSSVDIEFEDASGSAFDVVEAFANYNPEMSGWKTLSTSKPWQNIPVANYDGLTSLDKARTVTLTFADGEANKHHIILPSSNIVLKETGVATGAMILLGSNTRQVSGYTDDELGIWNTPRNYRNAGIVIRGSWGKVQIEPGQFGDVYANGDGEDDEIQLLTFRGSFVRASETATNYELTGQQKGQDSQIALRVTDMLINRINYYQLGDNAETHIFTTGNSAIKRITETDMDHTNKVNLSASWTQQKLSDYALANGYDQSEIFTAAQLSSMGLASKSTLGTSPYNYYMAVATRSVWLGGTYFPWVGADVTNPLNGPITEDFTFDGKNCNFRNMYFDLYEPALPIECCCEGPNRIAVDEGLGLIRRIDTEGAATIKNVDLSDALMDAHRFNIDNIGSICGRISADAGITLTDNSAHAIRLDANGSNIGGAFGWLNSDAFVTIENLTVAENSAIYGKSWVVSKSDNVGGAVGLISGDDPYVMDGVTGYTDEVSAIGVKVYNEFVISQANNVGGQVGFIKAGTLTYGKGMGDNTAHVNDKVRTIGANVGGLIGLAYYQDNATLVRGTVEVGQEIYAEYNAKAKNFDNSNLSGSNVGGLVGYMYIYAAKSNQTNKTEVEGSVRVDGNVIAENRNAGGFVGQYQANNLKTGDSDNANKVNIKKTLEGIEGYVGGLYGILNAGDEIQIGRNAKKGSIAISVGEFAGAMAVGGIVGYNNNGSATADNENQLKIITAADKYPISVKAPAWTNTKNGTVKKTQYTRPDYVSPCVTTEANESDFYPGWYAGSNQAKAAGSFGTVIGMLNNVISITDANLTITAKDGVLQVFSRTDTNYWGAPTFTSKNPIFTNDKKVNLLFVLQNVSQSTQIQQALTGQGTYFWGDENGYVGVNNNSAAGGGSYKLNGTPLQGNVNYNLYYDWTTPLTGFLAADTPWE